MCMSSYVLYYSSEFVGWRVIVGDHSVGHHCWAFVTGCPKFSVIAPLRRSDMTDPTMFWWKCLKWCTTIKPDLCNLTALRWRECLLLFGRRCRRVRNRRERGRETDNEREKERVSSTNRSTERQRTEAVAHSYFWCSPLGKWCNRQPIDRIWCRKACNRLLSK